MHTASPFMAQTEALFRFTRSEVERVVSDGDLGRRDVGHAYTPEVNDIGVLRRVKMHGGVVEGEGGVRELRVGNDETGRGVRVSALYC